MLQQVSLQNRFKEIRSVIELFTEEKDRADWKEAEFLHNVAGQRYHRTLETTAYRVVQEALTNARKHAQADRVRLLLLAEANKGSGVSQLILEVRDWGRGFIPEPRAEENGHVGLQSMFERVNLIGGTYTLQSAPGEGTRIRAVFPALEPADQEEREAK